MRYPAAVATATEPHDASRAEEGDGCPVSVTVQVGAVALTALLSGARRSHRRMQKRGRLDGQFCGRALRRGVERLLREMGGRCTYCRHPLKIQKGNADADQLTLDRLCTDVGYLPENVVVCCLFCNRARNVGSPMLYSVFARCLFHSADEELMRRVPGLTLVRDLPPRALRAVMASMTRHCREVPGAWLRCSWVREQLARQGFRCALSGLPLAVIAADDGSRNPSTRAGHDVSGARSSEAPPRRATVLYCPFSPSVDRIDNGLPHVPGNCHIAALGVNLGRGSMHLAQANRWLSHRRAYACLPRPDEAYCEAESVPHSASIMPR